MSTNRQKVEAQKRAFFHRPCLEWQRHLIGHVELEQLLESDKQLRRMKAEQPTFTPDTPKKEGWYWVLAGNADPFLAKLVAVKGEGLVIYIGAFRYMSVFNAMKQFDSIEFAGPIPFPKL